MQWQVGWALNLGRRDTQQDFAKADITEDGRAILVLADGAGGHDGGAIASSAAGETALSYVKTVLASDPHADI